MNERAREFALLRAVAFSREQIAALVALESLALTVVGWLGGLLAGFLLVLIGSLSMPSLFTSGAALGWTCVWLTGATVLLGDAVTDRMSLLLRNCETQPPGQNLRRFLSRAC